MSHTQYRFKFYFNASHAIYLSGEMGQRHPHTWEVILNVLKVTNNLILFDEVEKICEEFFSDYQDVFINTVQPFITINPTLENLCTYFKDKLQEMLHEKGWLLLSIELSETPSRSYIISVTNELEFGKFYFDREAEETLQGVIDKMASKKMNSILKAKTTSPQETGEMEKELKEIAHRVIEPKKKVLGMLAGKKFFK